MTLHGNVDGFLSMTVSVQFTGSPHVKFKVSIIDSEGAKHCFYDKFRDVKDKPKIHISKFISRADLFNRSNGYLPGDTLILHCEFGFLDDAKNTVINGTGASTEEITQKAMEDYECLLKSGTFADVKLIVGGMSFLAHKSILAARSPVFSAMFTHEMKEKQEGKVEIPDADPEAFAAFLEFLYTGMMPILGEAKLAQDLLIISDKYECGQLKSICEDTLCTQLTLETAPHLLLTADKYGLKQLKIVCEDFLSAQVTIETAANFFNLANQVNAFKLREGALQAIRSQFNEQLATLKDDPNQILDILEYLAEKNDHKKVGSDSEKGNKRKLSED